MKVNNNSIKGMLLSLKKVLNLLFRFKKIYLVLLLVVSFINAIVPYVSLLLSQNILNELQLRSKTMQHIIILLLAYLIINILSILITNIYAYISKKYSDYLFYELNLFFRYEGTYLTYQDFENENTYNSLQRAEQQIGVRPFAIVNDLLTFLSTFTSFILSMAILSIWHYWIVFGFIILPIISYRYFIKVNKIEYDYVMQRTEEERKTWYIAHLLMKDYFIKEIKLLNISDYLLNILDKILKKIYKQNIEINTKKTIFNIGYQLSNTIFSFVVIVVSFFETLKGNLLIGNFMTNINTTSKIEGAISGMVNSLFTLYNDCLYVSYLFDFFDITEKRKNIICSKKKIIKEIKKIELRNVSYKYKNKNIYALKNINIEINCGEIIALVGENGSGKTTLIKILTGLYTDYEGEIFVNGINIKDIDILSLREKMGVIFQDFNNYEFSVQENIGLGDVNNINDISRIKKVAGLTGIDKTIELLPKKYDQQLGNWFKDGIQLSGGQWQKIAISRTLMRNADIFILDEPTASLDPSSEHEFFKNFTEVVNTNIRMFVTHRFTNASISNHIILLKDGIIVEEGRHDDLINLNGQYAKLYKLQVGEKI